MKHTFTDEEIQAAIDKALSRASITHFCTIAKSDIWDGQSHFRLDLVKELLTLLPEPPTPVVDGKTPGQVNHDAVTNGDYDTYKKWSELSERGKRDVERGASAVLAAFGNKPAASLNVWEV